ncbi:calcium-binding protein [Sulfitobacter sp.]|uniref:calcium-binding protein n=1 Tax=Sulfitobacter sp. TaxID=1903071 RepID=UPI0030030EE6
MLMLLGLALPMAILGFAVNDSDNDDEDTVELTGTEEADRFEGEEGNDFLDGMAGDDVMNGRAGNDTIFGRDGDDVLQGEDGDDMLCSGDGEDIITGNRGQDLIEGQGGDDWVSGDYGWDTVRGDEGNDTVLGGRGTDDVRGGEGDDIVFGGIIDGIPLDLEEMVDLRGGDSLSDLNGGIDLRDDSMGNVLGGGEGDDQLIVGSLDIANGNEGNDTFHIMSEQSDPDAGATIRGFNSAEDAITIIVDDTSADYDVTVTDEGDDVIIRMGDNVLATIPNRAGEVSIEDITLIAENTVEALFDPNAAAA